MGILDGIVGGVVDQVKRGTQQAVQQTVQQGVQRPINEAVTGAGQAVKDGTTGVISGAFKDKAQISASVSELPPVFDPRKSPEMTKAMEVLLGGRRDGKLDGADLQSFNKFQAQQGNKAISDWESVRREDVGGLIEAAASQKSAGAKNAMAIVIPAFNNGVKEIAAIYGTQAPAPASAPAASGPDVGAAVGNAANKVGDAVGGAFSWIKEQANKPRPPTSEPNGP